MCVCKRERERERERESVAKALLSLRICACSSESSLLDNTIIPNLMYWTLKLCRILANQIKAISMEVACDIFSFNQ